MCEKIISTPPRSKVVLPFLFLLLLLLLLLYVCGQQANTRSILVLCLTGSKLLAMSQQMGVFDINYLTNISHLQ